ncbi:dethiobiotin synthase [Methylacidimicrobium tartarophylax]|uniref:ATP-dependent dethiobiotin synthetase BioD n=1 Tax=Methylacidimicrobium tartarophylax TaxID=1041768 RepID=A0A5E6MFE3_9BACT|nr:dethiobiotin synthase [Methylacidimicrobium tartarophylax]VVM06563.1 dethiobiotin synthetase [Methylacidimicrobium tartarophylax]
MQPEKRFHLFLSGTGTDVGKTVCGAALLEAWRRLGWRPVGLKPIATGSQDDALRLQAGAGTEMPLSAINPFFFRCPAAPAIAAEEEGRTLNLEEVAARVRPLLWKFSCAIVEGVGGWKTPLTRTETVSDLAAALGLPVIVVALCRLGVLNHALLTVESIRAAGLTPLGILLNGFSEPSARTRAQTAACLRRHVGVSVASFREASELRDCPPPWLLPGSRSESD